MTMDSLLAKAEMAVKLAVCGVIAWLAAACVWLMSLPKAPSSYAPIDAQPYVVSALVLVAGAVWMTRRSRRLLTEVVILMAVGGVIAAMAAPQITQSYESTMEEFRRSHCRSSRRGGSAGPSLAQRSLSRFGSRAGSPVNTSAGGSAELVGTDGIANGKEQGRCQ